MTGSFQREPTPYHRVPRWDPFGPRDRRPVLAIKFVVGLAGTLLVVGAGHLGLSRRLLGSLVVASWVGLLGWERYRGNRTRWSAVVSASNEEKGALYASVAGAATRHDVQIEEHLDPGTYAVRFAYLDRHAIAAALEHFDVRP